ncbi:MAG: CBS domain-containing protein [Acidobacteriota bacterium]|nr:CBS domain-containing protein [Acidobacteriota bacterium]
MTVRKIMKPNPTSVTSTTPTLEAIEIMRRSSIGCLPVVDNNQLVGIVTSYDFLTATASLFKQHWQLRQGLQIRRQQYEEHQPNSSVGATQ